MPKLKPLTRDRIAREIEQTALNLGRAILRAVAVPPVPVPEGLIAAAKLQSDLFAMLTGPGVAVPPGCGAARDHEAATTDPAAIDVNPPADPVPADPVPVATNNVPAVV